MGYIVVRGAGDLATGVIQKLYRAGFSVVAAETREPSAVRRLVSLSECVYLGEYTVEGITAKRVEGSREIDGALKGGLVPVIIDPKGLIIRELKPFAVVDAIIAKRNLGTSKSMAPITIALGPGFRAPDDVDCVIETMRGHNLGRLIFEGEALPNTGSPEDVAGKSIERVMRAGIDGTLKTHIEIGDIVAEGRLVCEISGDSVQAITAPFEGVLRGILRDGTRVSRGMKLGDIDPRPEEAENSATISDKARNLGGAVLEAVMYLKGAKRV